MSRKRILVIDDEASFTRNLKLNLEETGEYEVREENKGTEGLTAAREFRPDLILLDVIMPDMAGGDNRGPPFYRQTSDLRKSDSQY